MKPLKRIDFAAPPVMDKVGEPFEDDDDDDDDEDNELDEHGASSSSSNSEHRSRRDGSGNGHDDTASLHKRTVLPQLEANAAASMTRPGPGVNGSGGSMSSANIINGRTNATDGGAAGGAFGRWL